MARTGKSAISVELARAAEPNSAPTLKIFRGSLQRADIAPAGATVLGRVVRTTKNPVYWVAAMKIHGRSYFPSGESNQRAVGMDGAAWFVE